MKIFLSFFIAVFWWWQLLQTPDMWTRNFYNFHPTCSHQNKRDMGNNVYLRLQQ